MSTILVVEDNENNLMLVRDVLELKGHTVLAAGTGAEGVMIAADAKPDLVLMDIQLPDIDGITALARIRADERSKAIPVLAVSASVMPEEQKEVAASGFDGFVPKPINVKQFLETVARILGSA